MDIEKDKFPSQLVPILREYMKLVLVCISSIKRSKPSWPCKKAKVDNKVEMSVKKTTQVVPLNSEESSSKEKAESNLWEYIPKALFPQRLGKAHKKNFTGEIIEIFKQVHVNIRLLYAIKQVPSYAKFLKGIWLKKEVSMFKIKPFNKEHWFHTPLENSSKMQRSRFPYYLL